MMENELKEIEERAKRAAAECLCYLCYDNHKNYGVNQDYHRITDVPRLIAEVWRLQKELKDLTEEFE